MPTYNPDKPKRTVKIHWQNAFLDREQLVMLDSDDERTDEEVRMEWLKVYNSRMSSAFPMYRKLYEA